MGFQWYPVDVPWELSAMGWFNGLLTLGRVDGVIDWEQDSYNDENTAIDAYWESQYLFGKSPEYFKQFTTLAVEAKPVAGATLAISWTDETGAVGTGSVDLGTTDAFVSEILYPQAFSKRLKIKVRNNELNKGLSVYSLTGKYIQKEFG